MELDNKCACSVQYRLANISNKCLLNEKNYPMRLRWVKMQIFPILTVSGPVSR